MHLRATLVRLPLLAPFTTSRGTESARTALVLELSTDGETAFSECGTDEKLDYWEEDNSTALHLIKDILSKEIEETNPPGPEEFVRRVRKIRGNRMAKAAVEMLLWDYRSKRDGVPLAEALGNSKGYCEAGISLGMTGTRSLLERIEGALERGYKRVKVKIERGNEEVLKPVRERFPDIRLSADANGSFELGRDLARLKRLDRFHLDYIEQPLGCDDILDHAKLSREISTPICLDESITTTQRAKQALEIGAMQVINLKPARVGGLLAAMEIARLASQNGAHVWVGGLLETGIGRAFNVALASQRDVDYPGDTSPNDRYFDRDLVKNPFVMKNGRIKPSRRLGIGVQPDAGFIARMAMGSWDIF